MKNLLISVASLAAVLTAPSGASADEVSDRTQAIRLCRAQVSAQAAVDPAQVRLDQVRVRPREVRVHLDLWRGGQLQNIRCDVARGDGELSVAAITPPLQTASAH